MRITMLLIGGFLQISTTLLAKPVSLVEALNNGWISVSAAAQGGHGGQSIKASFKNLHKRDLELLIPAGFIFNASDSTFQDLIIVKERLLALEKARSKSVMLYGMCIRASRSSPTSGLAFSAGGMATAALAQMAQHIDEKRLHEVPDAQHAIWAVSNGHALEGIGQPDLAAFTAKLLGKPEPTYNIRYANSARPGERAFQDRALAVSGLFEYTNAKEISATFGLYNEQGERVLTFFEHELRKAGQHRFRFNFQVQNLPKGQYFARLSDAQGLMLGEKAIRF